MSIFDDITRDDGGPPQQGEGLFTYLNRSNRPEAVRVRNLVDDWLSRYPIEHHDALVSRFRSNIDDQHRAAFFELFLHQFILRRGHKVIAIEPKLAHTTKSPDFLLKSADGSRYYLEAVTATGRSKDETADQARLKPAFLTPNHRCEDKGLCDSVFGEFIQKLIPACCAAATKRPVLPASNRQC
jgi:hypothetical protein